MKILKRIIFRKHLLHKKRPIIVFENRLKDMFELLMDVSVSNVPESAKNEIRKQFLVMLVTSLESYLRDTFRNLIKNGTITIEMLCNLRKLKDVKFTLEELYFISERKISLSDLACEYINFQNLNDIKEFLQLIDFDRKLDEMLANKDEKVQHGKILRKKDLKAILHTKVVMGDIGHRLFKEITTHTKIFDRPNLYGAISILLEERHRIIHLNADIKISKDDILGRAGAVYDLVYHLDKAVEA